MRNTPGPRSASTGAGGGGGPLPESWVLFGGPAGCSFGSRGSCLLLCDFVVMPVTQHGDVVDPYLFALVPSGEFVGFELGGLGAPGAVVHGGCALTPVPM